MPANETNQEGSNHPRQTLDAYDAPPREIAQEIDNSLEQSPESSPTAFSLKTFLKNNVWVLLPAIILVIAGVRINTVAFWIDMAGIFFTMHFYSKFGKN